MVSTNTNDDTAARSTPGVSGGRLLAEPSANFFSDAILIGAADDTSLDRPMTISFAPSRRSKRWKAWPTTGRELLSNLATHYVRESKDGLLLLFGTLSGRRRVAEDIEALDAIGFDIDAGQTFGEVVACVAGAGKSAVVWTTHSHSDTHHKARVLIPLAETYRPDRATPLDRRKAEWRARYEAVGRELGLAFDPTGADLNRSFYAPAHRRAAPFRTVVNIGGPLFLPQVELPPERERRTVAVRKSGIILEDEALRTRFARLLAEGGERFDVCGFLDDVGWPIRSWSGSEKATIECPNEDAHTKKPGDGPDNGCVAFSGDGQRSAAITCQHAHCRDIRASDFLTLICSAIDIEGDAVERAGEFVE